MNRAARSPSSRKFSPFHTIADRRQVSIYPYGLQQDAYGHQRRKAMLEVTIYVLTVYGYVPREVWLAYLAKRG